MRRNVRIYAAEKQYFRMYELQGEQMLCLLHKQIAVNTNISEKFGR